MTIDKTIEFFNGLECHTPQAKDAREVAIETMRKYQKIKQIIEADKYQPANTYVCGGVWLTDEKRVSAIREVLEDGNVN